MKRLFLFLFLLPCLQCISQIKAFRFAFLSDTHIGSPNGAAEDDLRRAVADINNRKDVDFVVITGDITELGKNEELLLAKKILDSLRIPYYIIPGNHDSGWSESGGVAFSNIFGNDKFVFDHNGIRFIACASGPYVRMSDGHVPRSAILWLDSLLKATPPGQPIIFLNHYPIDNSLDNWYEVIDRLKAKNTLAVLCGHGHANKAFNFEGIPAVMGRSNLRAKAKTGGFNIVDVYPDSIVFAEQKHLSNTPVRWTAINLHSERPAGSFPRPGFSINEQFANFKEKWIYRSAANVISTPAVINDLVVFGNQDGSVEAITIQSGKKKWSYQTVAAIYSSPAVKNGKIVFASADSNVYCLTDKGKLLWKYKAGGAVLGSPLINGDTVFIGGSDHHFRAIGLNNGKQLWDFNGLAGPVMSTPILNNGMIVFGAWDTYLYALRSSTGELVWKWTNGSTVTNYSPAACIPVAHDGIIYVVAPDRFLTAIDASSGKTVWRTNEATVRESIGMAEDGSVIYGKTMNDSVVAFKTGRQKELAWKMNAGFGYEHVPSMLVEKDGVIFFGTKNGVVYAIDNNGAKIIAAHKIDNSMVNTVLVIDALNIIASTMDGKVTLLQLKK
jgi:outer membrane protein assembly factor BamB/predicted MPP superfamily phosphohydrolase